MGWEWIEQDEGAMVTPYSGFRQCLLDPTKTKPEDFFSKLSSTDRCTPSWLKRQTNMLTVKSKEVSYVQDLFMVQETLHYTHIIWHATVQNQLQLHQPEHVADPLSLYSTYTCPAG